MLTRRDWLRFSALTGAGGLIGCGSDDPWVDILPPDGPAHDSILHGTRAEIDDEELELVAGRVPSDILGFVFVVGGVPYGDGTPLFTGDGMVMRFRFEGGRARAKTKLLRTDCFRLDEVATGDLAFRSNGQLRMSPQLGARNFANTALVPSPSGRILATYDAGRPWEIDPETLDVVSPVGQLSTWRPMLEGIVPGLALLPVHMSSAHPVWDPIDDRVYTVNWAAPIDGLSLEPFARVLVWDGRTEPVVTELIDASGAPVIIEQSLHQIQTTDRYLILNDGAFMVEAEQMAGGDVTRAQRPTTVLWVVPKASLGGATATATRVEIPYESAHFLVERGDAGDRLVVALMHQNSADPSEWIRAHDVVHHSGATVDPRNVGMMVMPADITPHGRYVVDARTGAVLESQLLDDERLFGVTLWSRDERDPARPLGQSHWVTLGYDPELLTTRITDVYRDQASRILPLDELPQVALPGQFLRVDHSSLAILDALELPFGWLPMSPTFAPRRNGGPGEGYLVTIMLGPEGDELWILDAGDLSRGPLARLRHPQLDVGFSLHTCWVPDLAPPGEYRVDRQADYGDALPLLREDARALARSVLGLAAS
ncbi:MAG: carotenoid oxygenase family protein [Myxococcales bacterium]|nr:carotenoid oxygenase family protein [Myxococcales bacterium]